MTHNKQKQIKAMKDCLKRLGWKWVKVTHLHTNIYSSEIKEYEVLFAYVNKELPFCYDITVNSFGIDNVRSKQIVFLDIINALNEALKQAK